MDNKALIKSSLPYFLIALVIVEISCHIRFEHSNHKSFSIIYMVSGLLIAILPLISPKVSASTFIPKYRRYLLGLSALLALLFSHYCKQSYAEIPIDYKIADMLPVIGAMNERALAGISIYQIIPEIWGGMQPIYLPSMWLPFLPAVYWGFDMRWITFAFIIFGMLLLTAPLYSQRIKDPRAYLIWIPILLMVIDLSTINNATMTMTEEGVVLGWYAFLGFAIYRQNFIMIGIAVAFCLMSRYALAPWALMIGLILLIYHYNKAIHYAVAALSVIMGLIYLSGAYEQLSVISSLQSTYLESIEANPAKYEAMIQNSLGIAKFIPYSTLGSLHNVFLACSIIVPIFCFAFYHIRRHRLSFAIFMICSLKMCLVFFFNLLIMPYPYLFYTSSIISIALWMIYMNTLTSLKVSELPK